MLWYKSWLETRYRALLLLAMMGFTLELQHSTLQNMSVKMPNPRNFFMAEAMLVTIWAMVTFITLAGAGLATQSMQARRGLHSSMQYTLALPVSRLRMIVTRASIGWTLSVAVIGVMFYAVWLVYPVYRTAGTPAEMLEMLATVIACTSFIYFLSVFLATLLDDMGRAFGSMFAFFVLWWLSFQHKLPAVVDVFQAIGKNSPLLAHTVPWTQIGVSAGLSVVLFVAALQVARLREY